MEHNIEISTDKTRLDLQMIHDYLTNSYWAKGRTYSEVKTTIEQCLCFGLYLDGRQIGFARVLTDYAVLAYLMDVFILEEFQGNGFSKILLNHIFQLKEIQVNKWLLATQDAHGIYANFGFKSIELPHRLMELTPPPTPPHPSV